MKQAPTLRLTQENKASPNDAYYCGCKAVLPTSQAFKEHVLAAHRGAHQHNSSHFLSSFSQIVFPSKLWNPASINRTDSHRPQQHQHLSQETKDPAQRPKSPTHPPRPNTDKARPKRHQNFKKKEGFQAANSCAPVAGQKNKQRSGSSTDKIIWNGLQLIPNKKCHLGQFYCARCCLVLPSPESFVVHCFENCQQLEHPESSHFISEARTEEHRMPEAQPEQQLRRPSYGTSHIKHDGDKERQKLDMSQVADHLRKIYEYLQLGVIEEEPSDDSYFCGCGKTLRKSQYLRHIVLAHNDIVPEGSSHIVLRKSDRLKVFVRKADLGSELGWSCPCRPNTNMSGLDFLKHVTNLHRGISLIYPETEYRRLR